MNILCPYCNKESKLISGKKIYPHRQDLYDLKFWACISCDAYVGTHKNSKNNMPLGRLANKELRFYKNEAHRLFDPLWKNKKMTRAHAYKWLSNQLGIEEKRCHIGMFDVDECKKTIEILKKRVIDER